MEPKAVLYRDMLHPISVGKIIYDVLAVTVRSFNPDVFVRKRIKRTSERRRDEQRWDGQHSQDSRRHRGSRQSSRVASVNTSLNASAFASGELPPPVPNRSVVNTSRSERHRSRSRSGDSASSLHRRGKVEEEEEEKKKKQWRDWRTIDVTKQVLLLTHVLRAAPVAALHFICQLKTDVAVLPVLQFSDLSETALRLLRFDEEELFTSEFAPNFITTRVLLTIAQRYLMERAFLETNIVVRSLRSRRTWRNVFAWALRLCSHTFTDPIAFSVFSSILLNRVHDFSPVTGPLRYTSLGICKAVATGCAGVVLEMMVVPTASQMCQRAVVRVVDGAEYLLLRRYARRSPGSSRRRSEIDAVGNANSEDERNTVRSNASSVNSSHVLRSHRATSLKELQSALSARLRDGESDSEWGSQRSQSRRRHSRHAEGAGDSRRGKTARGEHGLVMRAIFYRVAASLIAQCFVQHPLTVLARMMYNRAVLHATGLLKAYDGASAVPLTWRMFLQTLWFSITTNVENDQSSGVPVVECLRSIGAFIGYEVGLIGCTIRTSSTQDAAIHELLIQTEQQRSSSNNIGGLASRASALDSAELMARSIASLSPLFSALHFTAIDKLLSFYMAVWVRLRGD